MITVEKILAAEAAMDKIRNELGDMGREIYQIRKGTQLPSGFGLDKYDIDNSYEARYDHNGDVKWPEGTPVIFIRFFNYRWSEGRDVVIPQAYLTQDWRKLEYERVQAEKAAVAEARNAAQEEAARQREANEKATYERLKKKFEG